MLQFRKTDITNLVDPVTFPSQTLSWSAVLREAMISGIINAGFSTAFMFAVFGREALISVRGVNSLLFDTIPQSLAVTFMASLVPSLIFHKKLGGTPGRRRMIALRSALLAGIVTALVFGVSWALLPVGSVPFRVAAGIKIFYGFLLGAGVTLLVMRRAKEMICP